MIEHLRGGADQDGAGRHGAPPVPGRGALKVQQGLFHNGIWCLKNNTPHFNKKIYVSPPFYYQRYQRTYL